MKANKELVHFDDAPVQYKENQCGWVDKHGRYWGDDEYNARWASCDTVTCDSEHCNEHISKGRRICDECSRQKKLQKWLDATKRPISKDDHVYYSERVHEYFYDLEEAREHIVLHNLVISLNDMLLYHCERAKSPEIDLCDFAEDCEDVGASEQFSDEIWQAVDKLNDLLAKHEMPVFYPSKIAVDLSSVKDSHEIIKADD